MDLLEFWLVEIWANEFMDWLSDRRSHVKVLRACHPRAGLYAKFRAGYRRDA